MAYNGEADDQRAHGVVLLQGISQELAALQAAAQPGLHYAQDTNERRKHLETSVRVFAENLACL